MNLNNEESALVVQLAKWFSEGRTSFLQRPWVQEQLKYDDLKYNVLIKTMEGIGTIEQVTSTSSGYASLFLISPNALQYARQIEKQQQNSLASPDIIEQIKTHVRKNPWTAWPIIVFIVLSLLIPFLNSLVELIEKIFGWFS